MKKSLRRLTVGLVLVLSGCSVHFHGEAGAKSSESSGDEDGSKDKPKDKDKKDRDKDKKDRDKKDDKKDDDKKDDDKKDDDKKDDDKKDDDKKDDDKKDDDKKPTPPKPVIDVKDGVQGAGAGTVKPGSHTGEGAEKPSAAEGVTNVGTGTVKPGGAGNSGTGGSGGASTGGGTQGGTTGVDPGKGATNAGTNTIRIKPDKGIAQGGRGEPVNPPDDGSKPNEDGESDDGKAKPDKGDTKGSRAGGGFAIQPGRSVPGLGTINKPIPVTGFECALASKKVKPGAALTIKGHGFDDSTEVLISGVAIDVRSRTATKLVAKLPKELENGGDVTLKQGSLIASCGKLEISKEGAR